eukprot:10209001-Alexandrium_andersonii.AAC.1
MRQSVRAPTPATLRNPHAICNPQPPIGGRKQPRLPVQKVSFGGLGATLRAAFDGNDDAGR